MEKFLYNNLILKDRRRDLRKRQTSAEEKIWQCVRSNRLNGLKFHRQYSVGPYILDFYCPRIRLAIELDGKAHSKMDARIYDRERKGYLQSLDIRTIRFKNEEVISDVAGVIKKIGQNL